MRSALELALDYLSRRAYTRRELEKRLATKGMAQAEIEQTIARVLDWGYLDDRRYASAYCAAHRERYSRRRVAEELRMRGVDEDIINGVMQESYPAEEEYRTCLVAARRIWPEALRQKNRKGIKSVSSPRDNAGRKLAQKGFPFRIITAVLDEMAAESTSD